MIVVSLTTIRSRLGNVDAVIASIMAQSVRPNIVVLNISSEPFMLDEGITEKDLSEYLICERRAGRLMVSMVENTGPYRKLMPLALALDNSNAIIVTADDDVIYPPGWLSGLVNAHVRTGRSTAYRARAVYAKRGRIRAYDKWKMARPNGEGSYGELRLSSRRLLTVPTGRDGVLYRTEWLRDHVLLGQLQQIAPRQDDLSFRSLLLVQGIEVEVVPYSESGIDALFKSAGKVKDSLFQSNLSANTVVFSNLMKFLNDKGLFKISDHIDPELIASASISENPLCS